MVVWGELMRYEREFEFQTAAGKVQLRVQQGGAGRFYIVAILPRTPESNEIVLPIPSEMADLFCYAVGKAADGSGE